MGREQDIDRIMKSYVPQLLRIANSYLKNAQDAEDVVQDVLIRYFERKGTFDSEEHEKAWLIRVTIHRAVDYWRAIRKRRQREAQVPYREVLQEDPFLMELLDLPEKYKTPMYLYYVEGYSMKEIADILQMPEATVGTRLSRGRKMVKEQWKEG